MPLRVFCPPENNDTSTPATVTGMTPSVKCQVCDLKLTSPKDLDPKETDVLVEVEFGPNIVNGGFNEDDIDFYSIYLTDMVGERLMHAVANVSVDKSADRKQETCCNSAAYSERLAAQLPVNVTSFRLEVVPVLLQSSGGQTLPAGPLTDVVVDWVDRLFVRSSQAHQARSWKQLIPVVVLFVAAWKSLAID